MPTLRILHLSDLHIANNRTFYRMIGKVTNLLSVHNADALETLAEIVYSWRNDIDAILISGDIATTGAVVDLNRAIDFFNTPPNVSFFPWLNYKREPTIQAFNKPIIIVPGNHDRFLNISGWPGKLFYKYFHSYWEEGPGGIQSYFLPDKTNPILAVISSDFSLNNISHASFPLGHLGQGRVYKKRLKKLIKKTREIYNVYPSCAIIWMIHFAPKLEYSLKFKNYQNNRLPNISKRLLKVIKTEGLQLIGDDNLIKMAKKVKIKYIFCGHTHINDYYLVGKNKNICIHCAGTSTCLSTNHKTTIHLKEIIIKNAEVIKIKTRNLWWDSDDQTFHFH